MSIVRIFGKDTVPCSAETVGAKAANLARMAALGLPVPPAFVLPVDLCADIIANQADAEQRLRDGLRSGIRFLEQATGRVFGDHRQPLLVSVRSGAARSMPGMLDTVLNVGCTSAAAARWCSSRCRRARTGRTSCVPRATPRAAAWPSSAWARRAWRPAAQPWT